MNPLNTASINTHIPTLQQRGVTVSFDAPPPVTSPAVNIPDANLRAAIETTLGKTTGASITVADMETLTAGFRPRDANISNLTGLEHATNLTYLDLFRNSISDLSPLSGLTNLTRLDLEVNSISDLSPLSGLTNLTTLNLGGNSISDLSPLSGLTNLTGLGLASNNISNISPLSGLTNLTYLDLLHNNISNISPLSGLTNLTYLRLGNNSISDLSPLVANTGLGSGETVDARGNPLNSASHQTHIPALQGRGVIVLFDPPQTVTSPAVNIPDPNLRAAIESHLGKATGASITVADMETLTSLIARNANISNLTGLEHATNLGSLDLGWGSGTGNSNRVSNLSPLAELTNLRDLNLAANSLSNLSPLAGLTNLTRLVLDNNSISNLLPLAGLTNLTELVLYNNSISNVSSLSRLTNLTKLNLWGNELSDISPLTGLTSLTSLHLWANKLSNVAPLSGLTNLEFLSLRDNLVSDISPLARLTNLTHLQLHINSISDISPLTGLTKLTTLWLEGNPISDTSPLCTLLARNPKLELDIKVDCSSTKSINIPDANLRAAIESHLGKTAGAPITANEMATLTQLTAQKASIRDLTGLEHATNLTLLVLDNNSISNLLPLAGLTNLTELVLYNNSISNVSPLARLTNLTKLNLWGNELSDISPLTGLTSLTSLHLWANKLSDIAPLSRLTNLEFLSLRDNLVSDISPLARLTNLTHLQLHINSISDLSPLSGLTNLTVLYLGENSISDVSPLSGLTNLTNLALGYNSISDLSPLVSNTGLGSGDTVDVEENPLSSHSLQTHIPTLERRGVIVYFGTTAAADDIAVEGVNIPDPNLRAAIETTLGKAAGASITVADMEALTSLTARDANISNLTGLEHATNLTTLDLINNNISDLAPFVSNTGLGTGVIVDVTGNPLNVASISIYIPILQQRGVTVHLNTLTSIQFDLSVPKGTSLIHVPLKVTAVDGAAQTIKSVADLYDALGGASTVNFLVTRDSQAREWFTYLSTLNRGTPADAILTDDKGIFVSMKTPASIHLSGTPLGENGSSTITLHPGPGPNVVGLPLNDSRITRVSDLFTLDGIRDNVPVIILSDNGDFKIVGRAGDPGDIEITGGQAFILNAQQAATVAISGEGWTNVSGTTAAPPVREADLHSGRTPVLALTGSIASSVGGRGRMSPLQSGFRVIVKNLSTGRAITGMTRDKGVGYQLTVVEVETGAAAQIGDILEISAQSPNPFIGVQPLQYTVTAEDVLYSRIQLPTLVAYEIPVETELLQNYPNPFNPETWIPYRLAADADVTLTIYDTRGQVVRTLAVGHQIAAVYERRSQAVYWDGRNEFGEAVASGVYFYHLSAGDFAATRRMLIIK